MNTSLFLVGVGGQGTILTSKILSEGLVQQGYDVKMSEIHGMAQRGGSVTTQIKFGKKIYSPNICHGEADVLVAFEKAEAVRHLGELKEDGTLIVNDYEIYSLPVLTGTVAYPDHLNEKLAKSVKNLKLFNAYQTAHELGNAKAQSVVMLGAIIKTLGLEDFDWVTVMKQFIPERLQALNIAAYQKGLLM